MIDHFNLVQQALATLDHNAIQRAIEIIKAAKQRGSMVFICGNGGSAATASHFACDLQKAAGVRAIALTDNVPLITAWANDVSYTESFMGQYRPLNRDDDVLVLLSCSGTSPNVNRVYESAETIGEVIYLVGTVYDRLHWGLQISVNSRDYGVIEDVHLSICHAITKGVASE